VGGILNKFLIESKGKNVKIHLLGACISRGGGNSAPWLVNLDIYCGDTKEVQDRGKRREHGYLPCLMKER